MRLNKSVDYEENNITPMEDFRSIHESICTDKSTMMKIYGVLSDAQKEKVRVSMQYKKVIKKKNID